MAMILTVKIVWFLSTIRLDFKYLQPINSEESYKLAKHVFFVKQFGVLKLTFSG